ncbi:MAG: ribosome recycling factor [Ruthenibacterium sp.]|jgi:ribosome recycling factor|nr:ribosome recycling factor [Oscillospiraceae bacterium]
MNEKLQKYEEKMESALKHLNKELASIRAGRANPAILDKVTVDYYGTPTPINQIAAVSVAEARVLAISPWDTSLMGAIERAILTSDIGINPTNDGRVMRLVFPAPTEERRRQLVKDAMHLGEEAKVAVRNIRRDAIDKSKAMKKAGELTEDDLKNMETDVQKLTDKYTKEIDKICEAKNKEIMEI